MISTAYTPSLLGDRIGRRVQGDEHRDGATPTLQRRVVKFDGDVREKSRAAAQIEKHLRVPENEAQAPAQIRA